MANKPVLNPEIGIDAKLRRIRERRGIEEKPKNPERKFPKDISFEAYEDLHYVIKNIAGRHKKTFAELCIDLLENGLKKDYKDEYQEYLEKYKKL